jgi:hypothetical protein
MTLRITHAFAIVHNLHGLLNALVGLQNERLMIRYRDALTTIRRKESRAAEHK